MKHLTPTLNAVNSFIDKNACDVWSVGQIPFQYN